MLQDKVLYTEKQDKVVTGGEMARQLGVMKRCLESSQLP